MQQLDHDQRTATIPAPPALLYDIVSDVTRTPEYSPEITSCRWLGSATGPAVGARFEAVNTANGKSWKNRPIVTEVEPGRLFAFARTERFAGTVAWRWTFEPTGDGTRTTVGYEVTQPISRFGWFVIERVFRAGDRRVELGRGMEQSLARLEQLVAKESGSVQAQPGPG